MIRTDVSRQAPDELRSQIDDVKWDIMNALVEIDDIVLQQNPAIEADYLVKVGYAEAEALEARIALRRARRRLELAQCAVNSGDPVDGAAIERALDAEYEHWQRQVAEAWQRYDAALEYRMRRTPLSEGEACELKRLYRQLARRLHPDINPGQSTEEARYFAIAQIAYRGGDVATLRSLAAVLGEPADDDAADEVELQAQLVVLAAQLEEHRGQLAKLKAAFPYAFKERLADPAWVTERVIAAQKRTRRYREEARRYDRRYADVVGEGGIA